MLNPFSRFYPILKNNDFFFINNASMLIDLIIDPHLLSDYPYNMTYDVDSLTPSKDLYKLDILFHLPHDESDISYYLHNATIIHYQDTYSNLMTDVESIEYDSIDYDVCLIDNEQVYDPHHDDTSGLAHSPNSQIDSGKDLSHIDNINMLAKQTLTHVITYVFIL